ncbi:MAG: TetR/AcrR family transcriptional regulator [Lachnospiraceae bacterium]|nr:TetR/AcrR family transcriptional regulator [Lachnospiraceae bacterium]
MPLPTFDRLPEEKKNRILQASYEEFILYKDNYEKASIKRIAKNAGVSIGSMYQYFKDKTDLFLYLAQYYTLAPNQDPANDTLIERTQKQVEFLHDLPQDSRHNQLNGVLRKNGHAILYPLLANYLIENAMFKDILGYLERDKEKGLIRDSVDLEMAAFLYLACDVLGYTYTEHIPESSDQDFEDAMLKLGDLIFHGIYKSS